MRKGFVRLLHNGMDVTFHNSVEEALGAIDRYVKHTSIPCHKISDSIVNVENDAEDNCSKMRVIVYQYYTLYMEVFIIKEV